MKTIVIIPTYNEKDNIKKLVQGIMKFDSDILFVDDNSPDGTSSEIEGIGKTNDRIKLINRNSKMGLGSAYVEGFDYALNNSYDKIVMMDADLSHPYDKIQEFIASDKDFIIGSRYIPEGKIEGWPLYRHCLSRFANLYAALVLNMGIKDLTSGFNCLKRQVLETIDFRHLKSEGYAFLIELKHSAFHRGFKLQEIPITFKERQKGVSKIDKSIMWEAFWLVLKLKFLSTKPVVDKS
jgi:dolichol-phosphate mannosyltransferase